MVVPFKEEDWSHPVMKRQAAILNRAGYNTFQMIDFGSSVPLIDGQPAQNVTQVG
jgi:hypothetical protein